MKCIIAHGDLDGIISASILSINYNIPPENIIFTQPFLLDKITIQEDVEEIYIVDIAVNNRNPNITKEFRERYRDKIKLWIDHHEGYQLLKDWLGEERIIAGNSPSCPQLMRESGFTVPEEWVAAANAADRPTEYKETELSRFLNRALKYGILSEDEELKEMIMKTIVRYLVKSYKNADYTKEERLLEEYGKLYEEIEENTIESAEEIQEILGFRYKVGYIKLEREKKVDITKLFILAYKRYDFLIIQKCNKEDEEITLIGTKLKEVNLVSIFNLKSGAPFRVSLPGPHEEKLNFILAKLQEL
jgi:oligoribonuclease NrnB/cAMP/cGMP phosphodiesterase (DHH superfamily)